MQEDDDSNSKNYIIAIYVFLIGLLYFVLKNFFLKENPFKMGLQ